MTISSTPSQISYQGDGVTTSFPIPFVFTTAADLKVIHTDTDGNVSVITTGFTVTGGGGSTGNLVYGSAPLSDVTITVLDNPPLVQGTDYVSNDPFPAESHEAALDYARRVDKRLHQMIRRSVRTDDGDPIEGADLVLPGVQNRAQRLLAFDANGKPEAAAAIDVPINALTRSIIGALLHPQTPAEFAAGITPTNYYYPPGDVHRYGALGDGATDDSVAIQRAFTASRRVNLRDGLSYRMNSGVSVAADGVEVDFGSATLINGGVGYLFTFGASADTPQNTGLTIKGGRFVQDNPATVSNYNYILIRAVQGFSVKDCVMDNISNGGITVHAGAMDGVIDGVKINGITGYSTCRGIWLNGATASDFVAQYVDTASMARNAAPFATYAVENVTVVNCTVRVPGYGVYLMNARDCSVENSLIDASGAGSNRCIAVNNYSPRTIINGNIIMSDRSCTGVLVTQVATDVVISNNVFRGSFGGNRAIYVSHLAEALITSNRFSDITSQHIQVDMGGFAHVRGNEFVRTSKTNDHRAVFLTGIDPAVSGTAAGSAAAVIPGSGVIFEGNILKNVGIGVIADTTIAASGGNQPAPELVHAVGNIFREMVSLTVSEYPLVVVAGTSGNAISVRYERNTVYPYTAGTRNRPSITGTDYLLEATSVLLAAFLVEVAAGGGAIAATRLAGNNFSLGVTRSGADLVLTPRTQLGTAGASVPIVIGVTDAGGATLPRTYVARPSGSNYLVSAYDAAGAQISFATAGVSFNVLLGPIGVGT